MSEVCGTISGVKYRSTSECVYLARYHVIWWPEYRRRVLGGRVEIRLKQIINEVVAEVGGQVIELETMPDHVHLLMEVPPTVALSPLIQRLKGRSSRRLRLGVPPFGGEFPHLRRGTVLWSPPPRAGGPPGWLVSTVGGAPLEIVRRYVENQKLAG
jgi:putative transposase